MIEDQFKVWKFIPDAHQNSYETLKVTRNVYDKTEIVIGNVILVIDSEWPKNKSPTRALILNPVTHGPWATLAMTQVSSYEDDSDVDDVDDVML